MHNHNLVDDDHQFIIDGETRAITNISGNELSIQQYDHNSERLWFKLPRYIEGHDMSQCDLLEVHYTNTSTGTSRSMRTSSPGIDRIEDIAIIEDEPDYISFSWTISQNATQYSGTLVFQFKFICYGEEHGEVSYIWHSDMYAYIGIDASLNNTGNAVLKYPDVIVKLMAQTDELYLRSDLLNGRTGSLEERATVLEDHVADLMYDLIGPMNITRFVNNVNTVEIGSTVTDATLSWTLNRTPKAVTLDGEAQANEVSGSVTQTGLAITADHFWTLRAVDERDAVATKTTAVTFRNGVYHGVGSIEDIVGAETLPLSKRLTNTKSHTFTVTAGKDQHIWYVLPERLGTCRFVVGGFEGGFTIHQIVDYTNPSGWTEKYIFYRSTESEVGTRTVTVS